MFWKGKYDQAYRNSSRRKKAIKMQRLWLQDFASGQLKRHIASVHEGKKPFKCSVCDYKCSEGGQLKRHISSVHERERPFKCDICEATFAGKNNVVIHIARIHEGKNPFSCNICKATFKTHKGLKEHCATVHEKKKPSLTSVTKNFPVNLTWISIPYYFMKRKRNKWFFSSD